MTRVRTTSRRRVLIGIAATLLLAPFAAVAQSDFPKQPIKLVLPFPSGSGTDGTARILAQEISVATGQSVIVFSRPGANGFLAAEQVARAAPDGYTLLLTSNTHVANKFLFRKIPYDPIRDFKSVTLLKEAPLVVITGANSPYKTLADLTQKAKTSPPETVSYASGNSSSRVAAELYGLAIGAKLLYVPYKGNPEALSDLLSDRVDVMFSDSTSATPHIQAGTVRPLAVTSGTRLRLLKDVPTTAELGLPAVNFGSWLAVMAPAGTPDAVVERLNGLFRAALQTETVRKNFEANASEPRPSTRAEMDAFLNAEMTKWSQIITKAGIEPQ